MKKILAVGSVVVLVGCGGSGGGGGGGGSSAGVDAFTSWAAIAPNSTVRVSGSSQEISYTADAASDRVTSASEVSPNRTGASYEASYGADGFVTAIDVRSAQGTNISWDTARGDTIVRLDSGPYAGLNVALSQDDGARAAISAEPLLNGWNYQSFGVWITGRGQGSGTAGVISVGSTTPANAVPQVGRATYVGSAGGLYLGPTGEYALTAANMSAQVNFGARTVDFQTRNTVAATPDMIGASIAPVAAGALDVAGRLTYAAGSNRFTGPVTSVSSSDGTPMTGTAVGQFYGPNANEIGGTFNVNGAGMEGYVSGFGGRR